MKKYSTPNTECIEMRLMGAVLLLESGEGSKTNPTDVNENQGLAPKRVF